MKKFILFLIIAFSFSFGQCFAAIDFDGVDDGIFFGDTNILDGASAWAIYVRFNTSATTGSLTVKWQDSIASGNGYAFLITYSASEYTLGHGCAPCTGTTSYGSTTDADLSTGVWHTIVWNGYADIDGYTVYEDNVQLTFSKTADNPGNISSTTTSFFGIGCRANASNACDTAEGSEMDGIISEFAIWNANLTATEISLLNSSNVRSPPLMIKPSNLKMYITLDNLAEGSSANGATLSDRKQSGFNGTGDDGANNTGLTAIAEESLSYADYSEYTNFSIEAGLIMNDFFGNDFIAN